MKERLAHIGLVIVIILSSIAADQALKFLARAEVPRIAPVSYLDDTVRLHYRENSGAFLSLGASLPPAARFWIFTVGVGVLLSGMLLMLLLSTDIRGISAQGFALVLGGGFGNFVDRLINDGAVVDFINVGIGTLRTGTFNLADLLINCGFVLLLIGAIRHRKSTDQKSETA